MTEESSQLLKTCPACGCRDLFIRKDFPQKLGLGIVVAAGLSFLILAASRRGFALGAMILLGAVVIDLVLYALVGKVTVCYRCRREFRDAPINPEHEGFELATAEKYRSLPTTKQ
jgi:hypothetical protein